MEWYGINLSNYRQQQWLRKAIRNIFFVMIVFVTALVLSIGIYYSAENLVKQCQQNQQEINILLKQVDSQEETISRLKQNNLQDKTSSYLDKSAITQFIHYLTNIQLNGSIEISQLYQDESVKIKLIGNILNSEQFEYILEQLKQQAIAYKVENFQTNEQNQYEFILIITLKDNYQDEKLDS